MNVALFTLGGTIAMAGHDRADRHDDTGHGTDHHGTDHGRHDPGHGVVTRLGAAELIAAVPDLAGAGVSLEVHDVHAVPSADLTFTQLLTVVEEAVAAIAAGAVGVVITQGTDTLEESAFLMDLVWSAPEPLVLTGAMRNPTLAGPDGPANLLAAVRVAAAPAARDLGGLVVMNDEIHAARWVRKSHSTSPSAFTSPQAGPVGHVIEGVVRILAAPPRHRPVPLPRAGAGPAPRALAGTRVALYTCTLDDDGVLLDRVAETHHGLVVAAYGVGHVPGRLAPVLGAIAERIPVVLTSRTGAGSVLTHTYGATGSETDLQRRGLINGGMLHPYQARVLLRLLLAAGAGRDRIGGTFAARR